MIYLAGYIVAAVCFAQLFRYAQHRNANALAVGAVNYVIAFLASAGKWVWDDSQIAPTAITLGAINGTLYWLHLVIILPSFQIAGVGITFAIAATSSIVPVLVAWVLWNEPITIWQWGALALMLPAMFLLRPNTKQVKHLTFKADVLLILNFVIGAGVTTIHKLASVYTTEQESPTYNLSLFGFATLSSVGYIVWKRHRPRNDELAIGAVVGAINATTLTLIMLSLAVLPTAVFYPVGSTSVILVNLIVSHVLWSERISIRQKIGVILAIGVILLTNMN